MERTASVYDWRTIIDGSGSAELMLTHRVPLASRLNRQRQIMGSAAGGLLYVALRLGRLGPAGGPTV